MSILKKAVTVVLPFLAGCYVVYEESPHRYEAPVQTEVTVGGTPEEEEVDYVVYREYFGCRTRRSPIFRTTAATTG